MDDLIQPSLIALLFYCGALFFMLRYPPPPAVLGPALTFLSGGLVFHAATWFWGLPLSESAHQVVVQVYYAGVIISVPAWLLLAVRFAAAQGHPSRIDRPWLEPALAASALLFAAIFLTNPWHELMLTPRVGKYSQFHPGYWFFVLWGCSAIAVASGVYLSLAHKVRSRGVRARTLAIFFSCIMMIVGSLHQTIWTPVSLFSPGQVLWVMGTVLVVAGIYGTRLFALSQVGLHRAVEHQADGVLLVDEDGLLLYANPAAERMLGREEMVIDQPVYPLLASQLEDSNPGGAPLEADRLRHRLEGDGAPGGGVLFRMGDRWLRISFNPIPGVGGRVRSCSLLLSDHTALQEATERIRERERELRVSEERYRVLFEESPLGVLVVDPELRIVSANDALHELLGASDADQLADLLFEERGADDQPSVRDYFQRAIDTLQPVVAERRWLRDPDHPVHVRIHVSTLTDAGGTVTGFQAILEDVSEHRRLQERVVHGQKLEAVGQLAGGVAHDFNNYLTVILGNADVLLRGLAGNRGLAEAAREISQAAKRSASLTRQLLAFSRKQVFQPRVIDVSALVSDLDGMLRRVLGEQVTLETVLPDDSLCAKVDPSQLEVVLLNLAINAQYAMRNGGTLTVVTHGAEITASDSALPDDEPPGSYVVIEVTDTGEGIDAATLDRIFDPFFTTKQQGEGTGLGLSTVYGIVRQSGGFVTVDSEPGEGATFRIHLPRLSTRPEAGSAPEVATLPRGSGTILLVEDEGRLRALVRNVLEENGYLVLEAMDGRQALERVGDHVGDIDLVITDLIMPRMGGIELASRLREQRGEVRVLYTSGYVDRVTDAQHLRDPEVAFLQKPFTMTDLLLRVSEQLQAGKADEDVAP